MFYLNYRNWIYIKFKIYSLVILSFLLISCAGLPTKRIIILDKQLLSVEDGDTIIYKNKNIRFLAVDCPETKHSWFIGDQEPYASEAKAFTAKMINSAEKVEVILLSKRDRYGRYLGHIFVDGNSLSLLLVKNSFAYETVSLYGDNGFKKLSDKIIDAARENEKPKFREPWIWRQENRSN